MDPKQSPTPSDEQIQISYDGSLSTVSFGELAQLVADEVRTKLEAPEVAAALQSLSAEEKVGFFLASTSNPLLMVAPFEKRLEILRDLFLR